LVCLVLSWRATIEHAAINIDPSVADCRLQCRSTNGTCPRPGIEAYEDKLGDVSAAASFGLHPFLHFSVAPRCPDQRCSLRSGERALAWRALVRQNNGSRVKTHPFPPVVIDSGAKILKFSAGRCISRPLRNVRPAQVAVDVAEHLVA